MSDPDDAARVAKQMMDEWNSGRNLPTAPPLSDDELNELARLCERASPGPWTHFTENASDPQLDEDASWEVITPTFTSSVILASELEPEDADFIVAARSMIPRLVAEVREMRRRDMT